MIRFVFNLLHTHTHACRCASMLSPRQYSKRRKVERTEGDAVVGRMEGRREKGAREVTNTLIPRVLFPPRVNDSESAKNANSKPTRPCIVRFLTGRQGWRCFCALPSYSCASVFSWPPRVARRGGVFQRRSVWGTETCYTLLHEKVPAAVLVFHVRRSQSDASKRFEVQHQFQ